MKVRKIIDPVHRMEGHMGLDIMIDNGVVSEAKIQGPIYRGFEKIMIGRDYGDAQVLPIRICGVCPMVHTVCSSKAVESLFNNVGIEYNDNLRLLRNIAHAAHMIADHALHFYHLSLLDYVQGPDQAPFIPRYDGDYRLDKQLNDKVFANYVKGLEYVRRYRSAAALIAGKLPHAISFVPGGCTVTPTKELIEDYYKIINPVKDFINNWKEDMEIISSAYKEYDGENGIGTGLNNFLSMGVFEEDNTDTKHLFKRGIVFDGKAEALDLASITEDVTHTWQTGQDGRHPMQNDTKDVSPNKEGAYSYITSPNVKGRMVEVGPVARLIIEGKIEPNASVMNRHRARIISADIMGNRIDDWLKELELGKNGMVDISTLPDGEGYGLSEAPRGSCSHWIKVKDGKITHWQAIPATNWNGAPKNAKGENGAIEKALMGTPVRDHNNPFEALRVVRSFDPCMACTVHAITPEKDLGNFVATRFGDGL